MKSIKTATLAILSVGLLAATTAFSAPAVSSDGFLVLTVEEVKTEKAKAKPRVVKQAKRATRTVRKQTRTKRTVKKSRTSRFYTVRKGDTLTNIAKKKGVRFTTLVRLNRLYGSKKNSINAGQRLRLR